MKKKTVISLLLAFGLLLTGCSAKVDSNTPKKEDNTQEVDTQKEVDNEETKLTVWVPDDIRIQDWNTNKMTLWLEEQTGYDLEIKAIAADSFLEKVNMSLTTGGIDDLPDIVMSRGFSDSQVWSWVTAETIIPLDSYYADPELATNINEAFERTGVEFISHIKSPDGKLYAMPTFNQSYGNEFKHKIWIYEPWLEALGKEIPTTTEEFYDLLTLVCATDLNENGKADEIGMLGVGDYVNSASGYLKVLMNPFVYAGDDQYRVVEDGTVSVAYDTDAWKEGLKYIKSFFDEKLIPVEALTLSLDQYKTMLNTEDVTVFSFVDFVPMYFESTERSEKYVCIDTLTGPDGTNYATYNPSVAYPSMVITANCKNPEAAFRIGDLMCSEQMGITTRWGEEGKDWDYVKNMEDSSKYVASVEGFETSILAYDDGNFWGGTDPIDACWRQNGPFVRHYGIACGVGVEAANISTYTKNQNNAWSLYQNADHEPAEVIPKLVYTTEESDVVASIESVLTSYAQENMAHFITGEKDIDNDWESYLAEFEQIGLEEYLEVVQGAYDRMYK